MTDDERILNAFVNHWGLTLEEAREELAKAKADAKKKAERREAEKQSLWSEDKDWDSLEPPPSMHEALEKIALAQADSVKRFAIGSDWKQFAIDKWGPLVARAKVSDWQLYVTR